MAKQRSPSKEVTVKAPTGLVLPMDNVPDYLKDTQSTGLEGLGKDDFKVPRIKLMQALNPEVREFQGQAIPGEFWHTGGSLSLGSEFVFVPCIVGKRAVLWDPNNGQQGGDILAFSKNGLNWDSGGDREFKVKLKGGKDVVWRTGKSVPASKLVEWGSSDTSEDNSPPAATLIYEYLCYLPDHPELSPCVMGTFRTAIPNAKSLNTSLLGLRKPTASIAVRCFSVEKQEGKQAWFVPQFKTSGYVSKELYNTTSKLAEQYSDYQAEYSQDEAKAAPAEDDGKY